MNIKLGVIARDKLTGFEGVVIAHSKHMNNCDRFTLQPQGLVEGKSPDPYGFDAPNIEYVKESGATVMSPSISKIAPPGVIGKDRLTGVEGIVTSVTTFSNGCVRGILQPKGIHNGKPYDIIHFDMCDLEFKTPEVLPPPRLTGGPRDTPKLR